jgi:hypothetical protein
MKSIILLLALAFSLNAFAQTEASQIKIPEDQGVILSNSIKYIVERVSQTCGIIPVGSLFAIPVFLVAYFIKQLRSCNNTYCYLSNGNDSV